MDQKTIIKEGHAHIRDLNSVFSLLLLFAFAFFGFVIVPNVLPQTEQVTSSFFILLTGVVNTWMGLVGYLYALSRQYRNKHTHRYTNWFAKTASFLGMALSAVQLLFGIVTMFQANSIPMNPENAQSSIQVINLLVLHCINLTSMLCAFIIWIFLWSQYKVPSNHLIEINGVLYYPGETYRLWPFLNYKAALFEEKFDVDVQLPQLEFANGQKKNVTFSLQGNLILEQMQARGIRSFAKQNFISHMKQDIEVLLRDMAVTITPAQLHTISTAWTEIKIDDFPMRWRLVKITIQFV